MFESIISGNVTASEFFACLGVSFILGLVVAFTHMRTARSSAGFITTLALLPMLVTIAIMMVNGNLGVGVAVMGIFSLVRFRSIAGNSRSILSVFFAMVIGLAVGAGYLAFAAIFTVILSVLMFILTTMHFGEYNLDEKKLTILVPEDLDYTEMFDDVFAKYTTSHFLEKSKTTNMGSLFELSYRVHLKKSTNEKEMLDKIRTKNGNLKVVLSHPLEDNEL